MYGRFAHVHAFGASANGTACLRNVFRILLYTLFDIIPHKHPFFDKRYFNLCRISGNYTKARFLMSRRNSNPLRFLKFLTLVQAFARFEAKAAEQSRQRHPRIEMHARIALSVPAGVQNTLPRAVEIAGRRMPE